MRSEEKAKESCGMQLSDFVVPPVTTASEAEGECNPYFSHFPAFGLPAEVTDCHVMTL